MSKQTNHTLVIVESPAKAKTIGRYLGPEYQVMSSVGHVRDLPKSNTDAVDIDNGFTPRYIISPGKEKVIKDLQTAAKQAEQILLASDPDREGEAIAWHVAELLRPVNKNLKRVVFNEITADATKKAIAEPRDIDENLKAAQEARRVLDRLVGYDLSGLIWKKVRYGLSAGRVQSPALRIVMEREREIRAFIPEDYFVLTAELGTGSIFAPFTCSVEPREKAEAERIKAVGETHAWTVLKISKQLVKRSPKPPFTTSTLQQAASTQLGFAPSRTMATAQKLYEAGHITYMRTDSTTLSTAALTQIQQHIKTVFGAHLVQVRTYKTKSKSAQEAHEAIRPTDCNKVEVGGTADQKALYELIRIRAIASQMADAEVERTKITTNVIDATEAIPDFTVNGSRVVQAGWLTVDIAARSADTEVPNLDEGSRLTCRGLTIIEKQTQPPNRYTEAGLIKELEKRGIGRPSTYASIMKTLQDRHYVEKEGRTLIPTDTGEVVSTFLEQHFAEYIADDFTSAMEDQLDEIAHGDRAYQPTLQAFYDPFHKAVADKADIEKLTTLGEGPQEFPCPKCGATMVYKLGRNGTFLSCSRYPDCDGARLKDGSEVKPEAPIGHDPNTAEPIYVLNGRYGPYVQRGDTPEKKKGKKQPKPQRAPLPLTVAPETVTVVDALRYLTLPRDLGRHPDTGEPMVASTGQFGPYVVHAGDYRSLTEPDNPYDVTYERALEILRQPKKMRKGEKIVKELGIHPKTRKLVYVFESKSGCYLKKGFRRINLPEGTDLKKFTMDDALQLLENTK